MVYAHALRACEIISRVGSIPTQPTIRGVAQLASAPRLGRGGPRFESEHPDKSISGYGSMVEQQISNLFMRVRFPLPAPGNIKFRACLKAF